MALLTDLRYIVRSLVRRPAYLVISTATLGLAIGLNTAIFSMVSLFVFEQFPMQQPQRLAFISARNPQQDLNFLTISAADFLDYKREATAFEDLAATHRGVSYVLEQGGEPLRVRGFAVTSNLLSIWRIEPELGRDFVPEDDVVGAREVVILGHGFWERQFASDPDIVGQLVRLNGRSTTVIGVMNRDLESGIYSTIDVWTPLQLDSRTASRTLITLLPEGRLKEGRTLAQAREEIELIAAEIKGRFPASHAGLEVTLLGWDDTLTSEDSRMVILLLAITVGCVMLIACSNVATLMLARASSRAREHVLKMALGASRRNPASACWGRCWGSLPSSQP